MAPAVRPVTADEIDPVSRALARAFADDPVLTFLCGSTRVGEDRLAPMFQAFQTIQLPHGLVQTTDDLGAAAIWAPPGAWKVPATAIVRHSPTFVRLFRTRFVPNLVVLADLEKLHPADPHYYLEFLGTDPRHQGKGYASALLAPMLGRADDEGVGVYLESSKESNVAFYGRFGFEVRRTMHHRRGGPQQWLMWRDPR